MYESNLEIKEMKRLFFIIYVLLIFSISCEKKELMSYAEVLSFNPDKCGCCWGWTIKVGNDIIKSADTRLADIVGYEFDKTIPIYLELGKRGNICTSYYEIKKIELIK